MTQAQNSATNVKCNQLHNPNYTSVRCTQPLPAVIKLRSNIQCQGAENAANCDTIDSDGNDSHDGNCSKKIVDQPLLLTNHAYEEHCLNQNSNHSGADGTSNQQVAGNHGNRSGDHAEAPKLTAKAKDVRKLGMFQYMKFQHKDGEGEVVISHGEIEGHDSDSHGPLTTREKLKHILHSKPIHIIIIVLVILDCILVVFELLVDLNVITFNEGNPVPGILHGFSIAILSVFMVEIALKIYADPKHFIRHKVEVLDAIVVVISFAVDIALVFFESNEALAALGLLVILRLWRVFRIINGIIVTIKTKADERVHAIKQVNAALETSLNIAEETIKQQQRDIEILREILEQNGIELAEDIFDRAMSAEDGVVVVGAENPSTIASVTV